MSAILSSSSTSIAYLTKDVNHTYTRYTALRKVYGFVPRPFEHLKEAQFALEDLEKLKQIKQSLLGKASLLENQLILRAERATKLGKWVDSLKEDLGRDESFYRVLKNTTTQAIVFFRMKQELEQNLKKYVTHKAHFNELYDVQKLDPNDFMTMKQFKENLESLRGFCERLKERAKGIFLGSDHVEVAQSQRLWLAEKIRELRQDKQLFFLTKQVNKWRMRLHCHLVAPVPQGYELHRRHGSQEVSVY